jgi:Domain of unknown function (DUF5658)
VIGLAGTKGHLSSFNHNAMTRRTKRMMLMLFVAVQLADVVTTDHALAIGALEVNPFMAWAQASLGQWWWFPKMMIACTVCAIGYKAQRLWPMVVAIGFPLRASSLTFRTGEDRKCHPWTRRS